jgi:hypothetical protein
MSLECAKLSTGAVPDRNSGFLLLQGLNPDKRLQARSRDLRSREGYLP